MHRRRARAGNHFGCVQPVGIPPQRIPVFSQPRAQMPRWRLGDLPDGADAPLLQRPIGGRPHAHHLAGRQLPYPFPEIILRDARHRIRLFQITAQFGKNLVKGYAYRYGQPQFPLGSLPDRVGDLPGIAEEQGTARYVQPAFVTSEGLHPIGVFLVDGLGQTGIFFILLIMGLSQDRVGAFLQYVDDGVARADTVFLGRIILRQTNAVPLFYRTAYRHGPILPFRMAHALHGRKKIIQIAVQNTSAHRAPSLSGTTVL